MGKLHWKGKILPNELVTDPVVHKEKTGIKRKAGNWKKTTTVFLNPIFMSITTITWKKLLVGAVKILTIQDSQIVKTFVTFKEKKTLRSRKNYSQISIEEGEQNNSKKLWN